jgi:hypothetical protein
MRWAISANGIAPDGAGSDYRDPPFRPKRGGYDDFWLASNILEFTSHSYDGHMFDKDMNKVPFPKDRYRVDALTDFAVDYLRRRDGRRPFFLFLSFVEPHHQNDHDDHFEARGARSTRFPVRDPKAPGEPATEMPITWLLRQPGFRAVLRRLETLRRDDNTLLIIPATIPAISHANEIQAVSRGNPFVSLVVSGRASAGRLRMIWSAW